MEKECSCCGESSCRYYKVDGIIYCFDCYDESEVEEVKQDDLEFFAMMDILSGRR